MYNIIKTNILRILPKKILFKQEENLRRLFSIFYTGNKYKCNVCDKNLRKYIPTTNGDFLCPNCGSLQRNRRLWFELETEFIQPNISILDFSPSRCLYRKLKKIKSINYHSTDLSGDFIADYQYDITNLKIENNSFDLVICYHILEHIIEDISAMREMYRIMKPGAKALIQTPFKDGTIYEDYSIISNEERVKHFGQEDHVRVYSVIGLKERLESCNFFVEIKDNLIAENTFCLNKNETILVLTKPLNS